LHSLSLDPEDETEAQATSGTILREVVKVEPRQGIIKRGVTMLKRSAGPVASGISKACSSHEVRVDIAVTVHTARRPGQLTGHGAAPAGPGVPRRASQA